LAHWAAALNGGCSENSLDCMELLSTSPTHQGARPALLSTKPAQLEHWQAECSQETSEHGSNILSASAPEFVPQAESTDKACKEDMPKRAALGDITNTQGQGLLSKMPNSFKKKLPPPVQIFTDENSMDGMLSPPGLSSPPGLGLQVTALSLLADEANAQAKGAGSLPSIGSAGHGAGTCKRCNFFVKGRCQNGKSCVFCHFPHDKPKMKRDRAQVSPSGAGAYPLLVTPFDLLGDYTELAQPTLEVAAGPPGLTQQTGFWQADEVSSPNSGALMAPLQGCTLLSTTPMAAPCTMRMMSEEAPAVPEKVSACSQTEEGTGDEVAMADVPDSCISREEFLRLRTIGDASNLGIRAVQQ